MEGKVDRGMLEKWVKGWALSRGLPLPQGCGAGFRVEVGDPRQKSRYIFAGLEDDLLRLAEEIDEPWVFLKACVAPDELLKAIPGKWVLQQQGYLMACFGPMKVRDIVLPGDYHVESGQYNSTYVLRIIGKTGEVAAEGRVVLVDGLAVYDRISTHDNHRRKGFATFLMRELEKVALSRDVRNNMLVATGEGKLLYESLGWELWGLYTSVVIPGVE